MPIGCDRLEESRSFVDKSFGRYCMVVAELAADGKFQTLILF